MSKLSSVLFTVGVTVSSAILLAFPLFAQTQGSCTYKMYDPPKGYIYDHSPGGINDHNVIVGGVGGPSRVIEKGYVRGPNGAFNLFRVPNNPYTFFTDRNLYGTTVGWYAAQPTSPPPNPGGPSNGLLYTSSSWAKLNYPRSTRTVLTGINRSNAIIGNAVESKTGAMFGFRYQNGGFHKIQYPGAAQTQVTAINDNGVIVGGYQMSGSNNWSGFVLQNGTFRKLNYTYLPNGINNSGVIVDSENIHYPDGRTTFVYVPGAASSGITGINDANVVTGVAYWGTFEFQGFTATCQ
jgi:hypothetical protein